MASKLGLVVLLGVMVVTESTLLDESTWGISRMSTNNDGVTRTCNSLIGDCIDDGEDDIMDDDNARRHLAGRGRYISYDALKKNNVPCNRPGQSYYNCNSNVRANPYKRTCTYITRCARSLG